MSSQTYGHRPKGSSLNGFDHSMQYMKEKQEKGEDPQRTLANPNVKQQEHWDTANSAVPLPCCHTVTSSTYAEETAAFPQWPSRCRCPEDYSLYGV